MTPSAHHRCGKHVVNANPRSQIPIWTPCHVHRSRGDAVRDLFEALVGHEYPDADRTRLTSIVRSAMLD
ncbi:MAG TPA: hypothetical protein VF054_08300 [Micromonosporaceae bacterium]